MNNRLLILVVLFFSFINVSFAQSNENASSGLMSLTISKVGLSDVFVNEVGNSFQGNFSIRNEMGEQNGINVGIVVYNKKDRKVLDIKKIINNLTLKENEKNVVGFNYEIPSYVYGDVVVVLKAEKEGGFPVGFRQLGEKTIKDGSNKVNCNLSKVSSSTIECVSKESGKIVFGYTKNSILNEQTFAEFKEVKAKEKITFSPKLTPGKYFVFVKFEKDNLLEKAFLPLIVPGKSVELMSLSASSFLKDEISIRSIFRRREISEMNVKFDLFDSKNKLCGTSSVITNYDFATTSIKTNCKEGKIILSVLDKEGKDVIASYEEHFSVLPFVKEGDKKEENKNSIRVYGLIFISIAMMVLLYAIYNNIKNKKSGIEEKEAVDVTVNSDDDNNK